MKKIAMLVMMAIIFSLIAGAAFAAPPPPGTGTSQITPPKPPIDALFIYRQLLVAPVGNPPPAIFPEKNKEFIGLNIGYVNADINKPVLANVYTIYTDDQGLANNYPSFFKYKVKIITTRDQLPKIDEVPVQGDYYTIKYWRSKEDKTYLQGKVNVHVSLPKKSIKLLILKKSLKEY